MFETLNVNGSAIIHASNKGTSYTCMWVSTINSDNLYLESKSDNRHIEVSEYLVSPDVDTDDVALAFARIVRNDVIDEMSADSANKALSTIAMRVRFGFGYQDFKIMDGDIEYWVFINMRASSIEITIMNVSDKI